MQVNKCDRRASCPIPFHVSFPPEIAGPAGPPEKNKYVYEQKRNERESELARKRSAAVIGGDDSSASIGMAAAAVASA